MEGLGHRLVVAAGDLLHEVLVEVLCDFFDGFHSSKQLILFLPCDVEYPVAVPAPFTLDNVPYPLNGVQLTTLGRKKLVHEPSVVKFFRDDLAVVD